MKKIVITLMAVTLSLGLTACGSKTDEESKQSSVASTTESSATVSSDAAGSSADDADASDQPIDEGSAADGETAGDYQSFAKQIQEAVASKNIEMLATLTAYPVYVGDPTEANKGGDIKTMDDFVALGVDNVITEEMVTAMAAVDPATLVESNAGYTMMNGTEGPSITFKQVDGVFGIAGINY